MKLLEGKYKDRRLSIEYVPTASLKPNEYNPNVHSADSFDLLTRSIAYFGFTQPIVVDSRTGEIVDGENRWRVAAVLSMPEVPVCFIDLSDGERQAASIMHNRARGRELGAQIAKIEKSVDDLDPALLDDVLLKSRFDAPVS